MVGPRGSAGGRSGSDVGVETLIVAVAGREVRVGHDGGRLPTGLLEDLGRRQQVEAQPERAHRHAVGRGLQAREQRGHGGRGLGIRAVGLFEHRGPVGQGVEIRSGRAGVPAEPHAISAQRVDADQDDPSSARRGRRGRGCVPPAPRGEQRQRQPRGEGPGSSRSADGVHAGHVTNAGGPAPARSVPWRPELPRPSVSRSGRDGSLGTKRTTPCPDSGARRGLHP